MKSWFPRWIKSWFPLETCMAFCFFFAQAAAQQSSGPFASTTPMPSGRQTHGSAVLGDYLYVFGGGLDQAAPGQRANEAGYTSSVQKAPIRGDGSLGPWSEERPLPQIRAYISNSTVALNDVVYIIGGTDGMEDIGKGGRKYKTALIARPSEDGRLSQWVESSPFPGPGRSCFTVVPTPGYIHIIGGNTESFDPTNTVVTGLVGRHGEITGWENGPAMPSPLWFHHSAAVSGRVWVWGGLPTGENKPGSKRVFSSPILATGRLGPWREEYPSLPVAFYRGANATAGPYLVTFCGTYAGGALSSDVVYAQVTDNGLGQWLRIQPNLPMRLYTTAAPDYRRGNIYIPGGGFSHGRVEPLRSDVVFFRLTPQAREAVRQSVSREVAADTEEISGEGERGGGANGSLTYKTQYSDAEGALPGFLPYEVARRELDGPQARPLIAYFHMTGAQPSEEQAKILKSDAAFGRLADKALLAWVDVRQSPQTASQFGVMRVPTWILYNSQGEELGRTSRKVTVSQLMKGIEGAE